MKNLLWVMRKGNFANWRDICTPEAWADIEEEWKKQGLTESEINAEIKNTSDSIIGGAEGFHILDQTNRAPNETVVTLSFDGEGAARKFILRKIGNQWKVQDFLVAGQSERKRQDN